MKKILLSMLLISFAAAAAGAQTGTLWDYSLVYQGNRTNWISTDNFRISTGAVGLKASQIPSEGFGFTWAFSTFAPFSLTFTDSDGERDTKFFNNARLGVGLGLRGGIAYAYEVEENLIVVPGLGWNWTYSNYTFNFPGGAPSFTESTTGPFASVDAALMLVEQFWLRAGITVGYEPFHSESTSNSSSDEDYRYGLVARFSAGVRVPLQVGHVFSALF